MKKVILFLSILAFTFSSCGSEESIAPDPFIGTWTYHQSFVNGIEDSLGTCEKKGEIIITADGAITATDYFTKSDGSCELDDTVSGTWENKNNNTYKTTVDGFTVEQKFTFEGNTFYILDVDGSDTYKEVYIRN